MSTSPMATMMATIKWQQTKATSIIWPSISASIDGADSTWGKSHVGDVVQRPTLKHLDLWSLWSLHFIWSSSNLLQWYGFLAPCSEFSINLILELTFVDLNFKSMNIFLRAWILRGPVQNHLAWRLLVWNNGYFRVIFFTQNPIRKRKGNMKEVSLPRKYLNAEYYSLKRKTYNRLDITIFNSRPVVHIVGKLQGAVDLTYFGSQSHTLEWFWSKK